MTGNLKTSRKRNCHNNQKLTRIIMRKTIPASLPLLHSSKAVVRSHICIAPLEWPVNMYLRGLEPIRLLPSHSCTQKPLMVVLSTDLMTHTLERNMPVTYCVTGTAIFTDTTFMVLKELTECVMSLLWTSAKKTNINCFFL